MSTLDIFSTIMLPRYFNVTPNMNDDNNNNSLTTILLANPRRYDISKWSVKKQYIFLFFFFISY